MTEITRHIIQCYFFIFLSVGSIPYQIRIMPSVCKTKPMAKGLQLHLSMLKLNIVLRQRQTFNGRFLVKHEHNL